MTDTTTQPDLGLRLHPFLASYSENRYVDKQPVLVGVHLVGNYGDDPDLTKVGGLRPQDRHVVVDDHYRPYVLSYSGLNGPALVPATRFAVDGKFYWIRTPGWFMASGALGGGDSRFTDLLVRTYDYDFRLVPRAVPFHDHKEW